MTNNKPLFTGLKIQAIMANQLKKYQEIIIALLEEYAQYKPVNIQEIDNQVITDLTRNHFQLVSVGWENEKFVHNTVLHFDIKPDGKVWLQANWTDTDIAAELVARGIEKSDIVLGFQLPRYRGYSGYAVA